MEAVLKGIVSAGKICVPWKQILSSFVLSAILLFLYVCALYGSEKYTGRKTKEGLAAGEGTVPYNSNFTAEAFDNIANPLRGFLLPGLKQKKAAGTKTETDGEAKISRIAALPHKKVKTQIRLDLTEKENLTDNQDLPGNQELPENRDLPEDQDLWSGGDSTASGEADGSDSSKEEESKSPALISVIFYGNGGAPEVWETSCSAAEFALDQYDAPVRLGKIFDGWYEDEECTIPYSAPAAGADRLELYAGWKEYPGFLSDDDGHVIGYTDASLVLVDGFMAIPSYETCTGIEKGVFEGLEEELIEIYIPKNITYIAEDAFEGLCYLMFIEVEDGNTSFYSEDGVLYYEDGSLREMPFARR